MPGDNKLTDEWPAEAKFAVVLETAALSEIELSEYCRRKGLYPSRSAMAPSLYSGPAIRSCSTAGREGTVQGGQEAHPATRARVAS